MMSDERLIRDLRALDRPVEVDPAFGEALYAILERERAGRGRFRPSLTPLLVAALLATLLLGGAVAVGSGLLHAPWTSDRSFVGPGSPGCPSDLPAGQLLELSVNEDGYADPTDEWGPTAGFVVSVHDDGLLLTAGHGRTVEQIRAGDTGMTARRLSPTGIRLVLDAAEQDALGSGCHDRWADIPERALSVRGDDGGVVRVAWGRGSDFIRRMTTGELVAAERLIGRLQDPESWLPPDAWIDANERPYVPDRWLVHIQLPDLVGLADPEGARDRQLSLPEANEIVLPDGANLLAFGDPYEEPDGAAAPGQPGLHGRCAVIEADVARSFTDTFADAGAVAFNQNWWFRFGSDRVAVAIRPLLPTDEGCTARVLGLAEPADPSAPPRPRPSGDLTSVDPCDLLSQAGVRTEIEVPDAEPIVIDDQRAQTRDEGRLGAEYRVCSYRLGGIVDPRWDHPLAVVHVRTSSTDPSEARDRAREILGEDAKEEAVDDRRVWHNGCDERSTAKCTPAIAISAGPSFIVVILEGRLPEIDLQSIARALASAVRTSR